MSAHGFTCFLFEPGLAHRPLELTSVVREVWQRALQQGFLQRSGRQYGGFAESGSALGRMAEDLRVESVELQTGGLASAWAEVLQPLQQGVPGMLVVWLEQLNDDRWLYLAWQEADTRYVESGGVLQAQSVFDAERLHIAVKLHVNDWQRGLGSRYLTLLAGRADAALRAAFMGFTGFQAQEHDRQQTDSMLAVVERYAKTLPNEEQGEYRERVIGYCYEQEAEGEAITLQQLAEVTRGEKAEDFCRFAMEHAVDPHQEWLPERSRIKRYERFFGRDPLLSISFSSNLYGQGIEYDAAADTLTIRHLPKSLRSQLQRYQQQLAED